MTQHNVAAPLYSCPGANCLHYARQEPLTAATREYLVVGWALTSLIATHFEDSANFPPFLLTADRAKPCPLFILENAIASTAQNRRFLSMIFENCIQLLVLLSERPARTKCPPSLLHLNVCRLNFYLLDVFTIFMKHSFQLLAQPRIEHFLDLNALTANRPFQPAVLGPQPMHHGHGTQ